MRLRTLFPFSEHSLNLLDTFSHDRAPFVADLTREDVTPVFSPSNALFLLLLALHLLLMRKRILITIPESWFKRPINFNNKKANHLRNCIARFFYSFKPWNLVQYFPRKTCGTYTRKILPKTLLYECPIYGEQIGSGVSLRQNLLFEDWYKPNSFFWQWCYWGVCFPS